MNRLKKTTSINRFVSFTMKLRAKVIKHNRVYFQLCLSHLFEPCRFPFMLEPVAYPRRAMKGPGSTHFSKRWSSSFAQKCNKLGGGGGVTQICQEVVSEILEKQAANGFSRLGSKILVSKKCLNTAGRAF